MPRPPDDMELIDVLDPDDPSINWDVVQADAPPSIDAAAPVARGRWPWVAAALATVAIVLTVVVVVVTGDDTSPDPVAAGRFVVVDQRLRNYSTDVATPFDDHGAYRVWAVGGPEEPHVEVQVETGPSTDPLVVLDGVRRDLQGLDAIETTEGVHRVVTAVRDLGRGARMVVRATDIDDVDLASIVHHSSIGTSAGRVVDIVMPEGVQQRLGLQEVVTGRWQDEALYGQVQTTMRYLDQQSNVVTLRVAKGSLFDQVTTLGYLSNRAPVALSGRFVGTLAATGDSVVLWQQGGYLLSLTSPGDAERAYGLSLGTRAATAAEWDAQLIFLRPDYRVGDFARLGRGEGWFAGVQRAERGGDTKLLWWFSVPSEPGVSTSVPVRAEPTGGPFADRVVVDGVTYVFVSVPAAMGATTATVRLGEETVTELSLSQPFADVPVLMAAVRVDEPGEVRVDVPGFGDLGS